jgi:hypothetical protein
MRLIALLLIITSCQKKEPNECVRYDLYKGKKSCVVGEIIWPQTYKPDFMREIEETRKNPRMRN